MRIVNILLAPLLAVAIAFAPVAPAFAAARGNPFYEGAENPEELAQVIEASLREDETGRTRVRPRDRGDRAFATPRDYLVMLQQADPRAGLRSVADLPRYLRGLVEADAPRGRYWSACVTSSGPVLNCISREFHPGEKAWVNAATGMTVFMQSCTNPIGGPERQDCYVVEFDYREQRSVRWVSGVGGQHSITSLHWSLTEEQVRSMYADSCYFVEDANGMRKPAPECPTLYCPPGSQWPTVALARAVGLPDSPGESTIHFMLLNGQGRLSLPRWVLVEDLSTFVPCVQTELYGVSVPQFRGWRAAARFDRVEVREFRETQSLTRLNRVLRGTMSY